MPPPSIRAFSTSPSCSCCSATAPRSVSLPCMPGCPTRTQKFADIRGLPESHPGLGWGLVIGVVAIAGLPPFGIFMSEFLIVSSTFARKPLLAAPLVFGLLVAFGALVLRLTGVAFGEPGGSTASHKASPAKVAYTPMYLHLALVLAAGIFLPP